MCVRGTSVFCDIENREHLSSSFLKRKQPVIPSTYIDILQNSFLSFMFHFLSSSIPVCLFIHSSFFLFFSCLPAMVSSFQMIFSFPALFPYKLLLCSFFHTYFCLPSCLSFLSVFLHVFSISSYFSKSMSFLFLFTPFSDSLPWIGTCFVSVPESCIYVHYICDFEKAHK